jgi:hypothetical protein
VDPLHGIGIMDGDDHRTAAVIACCFAISPLSSLCQSGEQLRHHGCDV